jgi:hypothetical protein
MLHLVNVGRAYPPDTVAVMTAAFDLVCGSLAKPISDNEAMRKKLALIILRHVDQGERDSIRLATVALQEMAGNDRSEIEERSAAQ